jgi:hypothetical protein
LKGNHGIDFGFNKEKWEAFSFVLFRVFRCGNHLTEISFRNIIKFKDFAIFTIPFDAKQNFALGIGSLPAGRFTVEIRWTLSINVLRTVQDNPAWCFSVPKI